MSYFDLVGLEPLMKMTEGSPEIKVGLIDGAVDISHPAFNGGNLRALGKYSAACNVKDSVSCQHGTFIAGVLSASRAFSSPGIAPNCSLLIRPIFSEVALQKADLPSTTPDELAMSIQECIESGVRVVNISAAISRPSSKAEKSLEEALNYAAQRGVLIVSAAGNQGMLSSTVITRHPWVIPVVASDAKGLPLNLSNLGNSIGRRGLMAPGDRITGPSPNAKTIISGGTSVAAPFVTGAIALLWSLFPILSATQIRQAITQTSAVRRNSVVPPLLDAWTAYQYLLALNQRRVAS